MGAGKLRVALVYPPFGPAGLPSLGLGLLAASANRAGIECYTYYWNLHFLNKLPGADMVSRMHTYWWLTGRAGYPFSEWIFTRYLYDGSMDNRDAMTIEALRERELFTNLGTFIEWRDLVRLRESSEELVAEAVEALDSFDIVGVASTFYQNIPALALLKALKLRRPNRPVVLGGANCDGEMGPALFGMFRFIDHVFVGECDKSFVGFLDKISRNEEVYMVPGLISRNGNEILSGPPAVPITTMDDLPIPDFDDFISQREALGLNKCQSLTLALESSRGCWWGARHHCTFCGLNANGMTYRRKSEERFRHEVLEIAGRYKAKYIFMTDNIMPIEFHDGFLDKFRDDQLGTRFFFEVKSNAKRSQVAKMAEASITAVQPGIESFSSSLLNLMRKGVSAAQNVAFLRYAREHGIRSSYNLLVGFPGADPVEYHRMQAQLPKLFHLRPPSSVVPIEFHRFSPYHQRPDEFGLCLRPVEEYKTLYPCSEEELSRIAYVFTDEGRKWDYDDSHNLVGAVQEWQSCYEPSDCTLTWRERFGSIFIEDRRFHYGPARYCLQRFAKELFSLLDEPRSISWLERVARNSSGPSDDAGNLLSYLFEYEPEPDMRLIRFERSEFLEGPDKWIGLLVDMGLVFEDHSPPSDEDLITLHTTPRESRYVALPVAASYLPEDVTWNTVGV